MKTQYLLNKIISEEVLAFESYRCVMLMLTGMIKNNYSDKKFLKSVHKTVDDLAEDEYEDHAIKLIDYAQAHEYTFPTCNLQYRKYAGQTCSTMSEQLKFGEDIDYYLNYVYILEQDAIASYQNAIREAVEAGCDEEFIDILSHNLEDEQEHLEKITISYTAAQIPIHGDNEYYILIDDDDEE